MEAPASAAGLGAGPPNLRRRVRRADAADLPAVVDLFAAPAGAGGKVEGGVSVAAVAAGRAAAVAAWSARLRQAAQALWVLDVEDSGPGAGQGTFGSRRTVAAAHLLVVADGAELVDLAVQLAWRRRGLGRHLLCALKKRLAADGVRSIVLEVRRDNAAGRRLYAGLGFVACGLRRGYYPPRPGEAATKGCDALLLRVDLSGHTGTPR